MSNGSTNQQSSPTPINTAAAEQRLEGVGAQQNSVVRGRMTVPRRTLLLGFILLNVLAWALIVWAIWR